MSILKNAEEPVISMRYIPYNGGAVKETWWDKVLIGNVYSSALAL